MKIREKLKQLTALTMTFIFLFSFPLTTLASSSENLDQLVNIVVLDTENETIIAQVPQKYAAEYQKKLEDNDFKQEQIKMMIMSQNKRALPKGKIIAQKYLYESGIRNAVNRAQTGVYESLIISMGPAAAINRMKDILKASSFIEFALNVTAWAVEYVRVKPEDWWKNSLIMLMEGSISCVRLTHIQNLKPAYPAAWLILERM